MNFERIVPIWLDETDSTNAEAIRILKQGQPAEGSCIIAAFQREGRGQRSNVWTSRPGENLLASFILYPRAPITRQPFLLSKTIALCVRQTIASFTREKVEIKWPNDILIHNGKVAGILIENQWSGSRWNSAIVGIGINVNQHVFTLEKATSLASHSDKSLSVDVVLKELQTQLSFEYGRLCAGEEDLIDKDYHHHLFGKDDYYTYQTAHGAIHAKVVGVAEDGRLELISEKGDLRSYDLNEVSLIY